MGGSISTDQSAQIPASPKRRKRVTANVVAGLAGVAPTTVSAILNNRPHCYASEQTRARVWSAARTLGYRPNLAARALAGRRTKTLGVVAPGYGAGTLARILNYLETFARDRGYVAINAIHLNKPEVEDQVIVHLRERFVDGVIVYPASAGEHRELARLIDDGVPVVTIGGDCLPDRISDVSVDNVQGGRFQAEHLIERGCRRLCLVRSPMRSRPIIDRVKGAEQAVSEVEGVSLETAQVELPHDADQLAGEMAYDQIDEFFRSRRGEFDGIIAANDLLAMATCRSLYRQGVRIPEETALVGFDDDTFAAITPITLSSVAQPKAGIAEKVLDLMLDRLDGSVPQTQIDRLLLAPRIMARESTAVNPLPDNSSRKQTPSEP